MHQSLEYIFGTKLYIELISYSRQHNIYYY